MIKDEYTQAIWNMRSFTYEDGAIVCPHCGSNNTHIDESIILPDATPYTNDGGVMLIMWCEMSRNHHFRIIIGFHKGCTYTFVDDDV